jgi:hypothetical protein
VAFIAQVNHLATAIAPPASVIFYAQGMNL